MAILTVQTVPTIGAAPAFASASVGGDQAPIDKSYFLVVRNGGASPITVTVVTPGTFKGFALGDAALSVPAGSSGYIPLDPIYRDPVTGRANVTYSAVTSVTVGVIQAG